MELLLCVLLFGVFVGGMISLMLGGEVFMLCVFVIFVYFFVVILFFLFIYLILSW